ncbi:MAG: hypothetical protein ACJ75G_03335 [Gaiellaceae bacterium]
MSALRVAAVPAALVAAACATAWGGTAVHVSTGPGPGFRRAAGWHVIQNGLAKPPGLSAAAAANVPLARRDLGPGTPEPLHTVASLPRDGVVIWAQFPPRRMSARSNKYFPPTTLPLRLSQSVRLDGIPEGFTCHRRCAIRTVEASASGYDIAVWIFFGGAHPSAAARAAADRELGRISVPGCPKRPLALTRVDLRGAARAALTWLRAHYVAPAEHDLDGATAAARRLSDVAGDSRFATAAALCGARAGRIAAVTVTPSEPGRKNAGSKLVYFLAETRRGWLVWRQG